MGISLREPQLPRHWMTFKMRALLARLLPFFYLGIVIVIFVAGIILFSYLLVLGAVVGLVLFFIAWLREKFSPSRQIVKPQQKPPVGRTFDHEK